jgi:hypothetical protein
MAQAYAGLSLVAVPTRGPLVGPFVLLEASHLGIPVWGSGRVGQLALLRERGELIEPNTTETWGAALRRALESHHGGTWAAGPPPARRAAAIRTMKDVSSDMLTAYAALVTPENGALPAAEQTVSGAR